MKALFKYILDRLGESSTWRGLTVLLTGLGVGIQPEMIDHIVATGLAIAGLIGVFFKDKEPATDPQSVVKK